MERALNTREKAFVSQYVKIGVAQEAALAAGYSAKGVSVATCRLLARPTVRAAIEKQRLNGGTANNIITERDVLDGLVRIREQAIKYKQYGPATRASELLGRHIGMFQQQVNVKSEHTVNYRSITISATLDLIGEVVGQGPSSTLEELGSGGSILLDTVHTEPE